MVIVYLIDDRKKHKDWRKAIIKLVNNPELIKQLQDNMYETVKDKYDIRNVTKRELNGIKVHY